MKIYLADLVHNQVLGDNQISGDQDYVVPLNIASVAAYAKSKVGDHLDIRLFKYPADLLAALEAEEPAVLGLSNYVWNADINDMVAAHAKRKYPKLLTVMGGPAVPTAESELLAFAKARADIDVHILFEGERPFVSLLEAYQRGDALRDEAGIAGCAYLLGEKLVYKPFTQDAPVDELPSPYLNGMLDEFLDKGLIPLFETNRGCPFKCTFCVWGVSALNKVRKYPLDRVFAEMDYVAKRRPQAVAWILADANFGILPRDVDIALKIRDIKLQNPALRNVILWESKNTSERNLEIARLTGDSQDHVLVAVQTLDPEAQKAVKRDNIRLHQVPAKVKAFHEAGVIVETHVLSGLPEESYEGHLRTLRKCFDLGFDLVQVFSCITVEGSEMSSAEYREKYGIKTRYRLRQGSYGEYLGLKSIEAEEIIRGTSAISEEEMLALRPVHWLIWYGWNHGFLKPVLRYLHQVHKINPVDMIVDLVNGDKTGHPRLKALFEDFLREAEREWFPTFAALKEYYSRPENWERLNQSGFAKVEFTYNAKMISDRALYREMLDYLVACAQRRADCPEVAQIAESSLAMRLEPDALFRGPSAESRDLSLPPGAVEYFLDPRATKRRGVAGEGAKLTVAKSKEAQERVQAALSSFGFGEDPLYAIRKTLGAYPNAFVYEPGAAPGAAEAVA